MQRMAGWIAGASIAALISVAGCAAGEQVRPTTGGGGMGPGAGGGAGTGSGAGGGGAGGGTSGQTGGGGTGVGGGTGQTQGLPFAVDDHYVPSGYMGDGSVSAAAIVMLPRSDGDPRDCAGDRPPVAPAGDCHIVSYQPVAPPQGQGWGGVFWQYPLGNWGERPGLAVAAGAQRVSFWARGAVGGERVTFLAGGLQGTGKPYQDTIAAMRVEVLTSAWRMYTVDLSGQSYNPGTGVLGGFGWIVDAADVASGAINFRIDGMLWQ